jgi:hypothetical protein
MSFFHFEFSSLITLVHSNYRQVIKSHIEMATAKKEKKNNTKIHIAQWLKFIFYGLNMNENNRKACNKQKFRHVQRLRISRSFSRDLFFSCVLQQLMLISTHIKVHPSRAFLYAHLKLCHRLAFAKKKKNCRKFTLAH